MKKIFLALVLIGVFCFPWLFHAYSDARDRAALGWCAKPLSVEEYYAAQERGDMVDPASRCIVQAAPVPAAAAPAKPAAAEPAPVSLAEARKGFRTQVSGPEHRQELPTPPADLFVRSDYVSGRHTAMPAYVSPDPRDGKRHPAIIWIVGGDMTSFGEFWKPGPLEADESAAAFREAGLVMMFPALRGSANNGSRPEYFYGEVDDVLAAAAHLARLPYVDPERIYLGGHSTGGTLALLVAEASPRFKAVFALGPMDEMTSYPWPVYPHMRTHEAEEARLRSPLYWLHGIGSPTYIMEGANQPANSQALENLCGRNRNALVHCWLVPGHDHFSLLSPATRLISAKIAMDMHGMPFSLKPDDLRR